MKRSMTARWRSVWRPCRNLASSSAMSDNGDDLPNVELSCGNEAVEDCGGSIRVVQIRSNQLTAFHDKGLNTKLYIFTCMLYSTSRDLSSHCLISSILHWHQCKGCMNP